MSCFLLCACLLPGLQFSVDHAAFRASHPDSIAVEFYHSMPYEELQYESFGDTLYAEYRVRVELTELKSGISIVESILEPALIPPKSAPAARKLSIGNAFAVNLRPGRYHLQFDIRSAGNTGRWTETLDVRDLRRGPVLSDLVIGSSLLQTSDGRTMVVPMAHRTFGPSDRFGLHEMYVYVAGYDFASPNDDRETLSHRLAVTVIDSQGRTVKSLPVEERTRTTSEFSEVFGLSTQGLSPGGYQLRVALHDLKDDVSAHVSKRFLVASLIAEKAKTDTLRMTLAERAAYTDIRYLATERELREYNAFSRAGKFEWLRTQFWPKHDFAGYFIRLQTADERFRHGRRPGRETDQGRIYLRYGEPDEIETHLMVEHAKPHEHWRYYRLGYHLIFVDLGGDGRLQLVYSNTERERKAPNWENLVDPLELENLQNK